MKRNKQIDEAVENLVAACGYDKSEAASEWFLALLRDALDTVGLEVEQAHEEGLCLDVTHVLASELTRMAPDAVREYRIAQGMPTC